MAGPQHGLLEKPWLSPADDVNLFVFTVPTKHRCRRPREEVPSPRTALQEVSHYSVPISSGVTPNTHHRAHVGGRRLLEE